MPNDGESSLRLACLISGSGSTLQNLIDRGIRPIVGVVASKPGIAGIAKAERAGLPVKVVAKAADESVKEYSKRVFAALADWQPDLILLCGWLKLLHIPTEYEGRVLNIHPSLLPAFGGEGMYGMWVHEAVIAAGMTESGCTVHIADNTYDTGPILVQKRVPLLPGDTPKSLSERVALAEREAYPEAITIMTSRLQSRS
jgi:phosphoribosylglycinamide formyltransferase-1